MHELSIAMSIVDMALGEAERRQVQISAVHLKLGPLSGVVKEALLSSYEMACYDTPLKGLPVGHRRSTDCGLLFEMPGGAHALFNAMVLLSGVRNSHA
jgi:hypothetical protein